MTDEACKDLWAQQDARAKEYEPGKYCLSAFSKFETRNVQIPSGRIQEVSFPIFAHLMDITVPIENRGKLINITYYCAKRIRNYLASTLTYRVPVLWRILGKDFTIYHSLGDDDDAASYPYMLEPMWQKTQNQIDAWFKEKYSKVTILLEKVQQETILDKCLNLDGSAIWSEDPLDAYMYRWRILELIANQEVKKMKLNKPEVVDAYVEAKIAAAADSHGKEMAKRLGSKDKIILNLRENFPEVTLNLTELKEENKLRDEISHGDVTVDVYERESRYNMKILEMSKIFLQFEIKKELGFCRNPVQTDA